MPKFATKLTDLQKNTLCELFSEYSETMSNKSIDIPLQFNSKYKTKYSYKYLLNQYLKLSKADKIKPIDSVRNINTLNKVDNCELEFF